jgi:predicted nucleic acid-binding Zn ribbon protein
MALKPAASQELARRIFAPGSPAAAALVRAAWPKAVGADLGDRTEVVGLEGGTLRVRVPDARWRTVLHRMRRDILARLRDAAGPGAPVRLGFVEGPVVPRHPKRARLLVQARPVPSAVTAAAAAIEDAALRERFLETAARYLSRFAHPDVGSSPGETDA